MGLPQTQPRLQAPSVGIYLLISWMFFFGWTLCMFVRLRTLCVAFRAAFLDSLTGDMRAAAERC